MSASAGASQRRATSGWTRPIRPARLPREGPDGIRERVAPAPAESAGAGVTAVLSLIVGRASAGVLGGLLQVVEDGLRVAAHRLAEVLLDGELDLVPRRVVGRGQARVGQRVEVDLELRVARE